jgi:single-stranded-DNA-specific exonuclease
MSGFSVERSVTGQPWRWRRPPEPGLGMDALVDELLLARGVPREDLPRHRDPRIRDFLPDPSCFRDMDKGAKRLADAIQHGETIAIFGDYDVDGATSAALLVLLLRRLGAEPTVYIPDRLMEGYGPSGKALVELKARGAAVAVCVDCGAQAFDAIDEANAAGLDVIVVDHHQCASLLPAAYALINPNRLDESEDGAAHGHLAAVGMAFLLGVALLRELRSRDLFEALAEPKILDLLDLVALGTVADVARLKSLNRAFVTQGLKIMAARQNIGLSALAEAARLVKPPSCRDLGFALGPRINAGGRVGKSNLGVRLLTCTDPEEARTLAAELDRLNEERRAIEMLVCEQAEAQAAADQQGSPVITVMSGGWHQGVIGIVAGRIKERFGRPAIVIAETEDGTGKGSGRSISGVDLGAAVLAAKDSGLLIAGGGHAMAAGLTLPPGGLEPFRDFINERLAADVEQSRSDRALLLDALLAPGGVAGALCDALEAAGPYGAGWPGPRVAAGPVRLLKTGIVGDGHVRGLGCGDDGKSFKWIAFRSASTELGQALLSSPGDRRWWLAGTIKRDEWNGGNAAEMHLEDAALA